MNRRIAHAASVATLVLALVLVPAAVAGRGKGQGQGNSSTDPSLASSCNPCDAGTFARFTGSGYDASQPHALVAFRSHNDGSITQTETTVNSDGTIAFDVYMSPAGTYDVMVLQDDHNKTVLKAELDGLVIQ
jgi:hypothetical protein